MTRIRTKRRLSRQQQLVANLSLPVALEEAGPPRTSLHIISVLTFFVAASFVWAGATEVGEVATTSGQIVPATPLQSVQHLEGGIVDEILVGEGSVVTVGQPLLRLRELSASGDLEQLRVRKASLVYQIERLSAYVEDRNPIFDTQYGFAALQSDQLSLLTTRREADANRRNVLLSQVDQKQSELKGLHNKQNGLRAQIETRREQLSVYEELFAKGLASRLVMLDARRAVEALQTQLVESDADAARAAEAVEEIRTRLLEIENTKNADALDELAKSAAELAEVRGALAKIEDRITRLVVRAPANGIVQSISVKTIGGVVAPGQELMNIVPTDGTLLAEVRVSPKDIGHVEVGQPAAVKVSAFDVARLGDIAGEISQLSPTTLLDEQGNLYYLARIALEQNYVGDGEDGNFILPGMVVTADVKTGSRSILQYLAGPAFRTFAAALRER